MKVLLLHNRYINKGGEDVVVETEADILRQSGHEVETVTVSNREMPRGVGILGTAAATLWSGGGYRLAARAIEDFQPDVMHVHNTFPLLSPSVFSAARRMGIPAVQTLHNYRMVCANALLLQNGHACQRCVAGSRLNGVAGKCYRGSYSASALVAAIRPLNQLLGSFDGVRFLALTSFAKRIFVQAGLPESSITVKPNSVEDLRGCDPRERRRRVLFIGRLAEEKGADDLIAAWQQVNAPGWELTMVGDGPLSDALKQQSKSIATISFVGWIAPKSVQALLLDAPIVVIPSRWYEGLPLVMLEALSAGCTLVVPRHGAFLDVLSSAPGATFGFTPESRNDLARAITSACTRGKEAEAEAAAISYRIYSENFSHKANRQALEAIYADAMEGKR